MELQKYIETMRENVKYGMSQRRANDQINGFIDAMDGMEFKEYRQIQMDLIGDELSDPRQARGRLQGFQDYIQGGQ